MSIVGFVAYLAQVFVERKRVRTGVVIEKREWFCVIFATPNARSFV